MDIRNDIERVKELKRSWSDFNEELTNIIEALEEAIRNVQDGANWGYWEDGWLKEEVKNPFNKNVPANMSWEEFVRKDWDIIKKYMDAQKG